VARGREINRDRNLRFNISLHGVESLSGPRHLQLNPPLPAFPEGILTGFAKNEQMLRNRLRPEIPSK
jgi:hypothetical protein